MNIYHSLTICRVPQSSIPVFIESIRSGGFLYELLRNEISGFITASVLQSCNNIQLIQVHCFWTSFDAYLQTEQAPVQTACGQFLKSLAVHTIRLGAFAPLGAHELDAGIPADRVFASLQREFQLKPIDENADKYVDN